MMNPETNIRETCINIHASADSINSTHINQSTRTTFKVFDISPNEIEREFEFDTTRNEFHEINELLELDSKPNIRIIRGSENYSHNTSNKYIKSVRNGFVDTIVTAYMGHYNIVIRPDDVWLAIITQFSFYVNANAEKLRVHFVDFKGQKTLTVNLMDPENQININTIPNDIFLTEMMKLVDNNVINHEIKDWILPNFSTTTPTDRLTAGVTLMSTMKNYFKYRGAVIICGIPNVTLEGSVEDWIDIRSRVEKLRQYDLDKWVDKLGPVLDQFVRAKSGDVDVTFWKNICHHDYEEGTGFGFYSSGRTYIGGWVTVFCPLNSNGKWHDKSFNITQENVPSTIQGTKSMSSKSMNTFSPSEPAIDFKFKWPRINIDKIAECYVDVEVIWDIHGMEHKTVFIGGHMAMEVLPDGITLQPSPGWVFALKSNETGEDTVNRRVNVESIIDAAFPISTGGFWSGNPAVWNDGVGIENMVAESGATVEKN